MEMRKQAHAVYYTRYHVVISTKYRRKVLKKGMSEYLKKKIYQVMNFHPDIEIHEVNTDIDHMHLLITVPPKMSVSHVVGMMKANTGKAMRKKFKFLDKVYWGTEGIWSIGYFVSTIGINEEVIRKYIEKQGREDCGQTLFEI